MDGAPCALWLVCGRPAPSSPGLLWLFTAGPAGTLAPYRPSRRRRLCCPQFPSCRLAGSADASGPAGGYPLAYAVPSVCRTAEIKPMQTTAPAKMLPTTAEVVVLGGGLAGAGAACVLAKAGREVLLLEREAAATHKICGEFLSAETHGYLRRLGLNLDALGGHPISHLRLVHGRKIVATALP